MPARRRMTQMTSKTIEIGASLSLMTTTSPPMCLLLVYCSVLLTYVLTFTAHRLNIQCVFVWGTHTYMLVDMYIYDYMCTHAPSFIPSTRPHFVSQNVVKRDNYLSYAMTIVCVRTLSRALKCPAQMDSAYSPLAFLRT